LRIKVKIRNAGSHVKNMPESTSNDTIQNTNYTVTLEEDGDDCILPLPQQLLNELGWQEGDMLEWIINDDDTITIKKEQ